MVEELKNLVEVLSWTAKEFQELTPESGCGLLGCVLTRKEVDGWLSGARTLKSIISGPHVVLPQFLLDMVCWRLERTITFTYDSSTP